jgi:hypothetical protein
MVSCQLHPTLRRRDACNVYLVAMAGRGGLRTVVGTVVIKAACTSETPQPTRTPSGKLMAQIGVFFRRFLTTFWGRAGSDGTQQTIN